MDVKDLPTIIKGTYRLIRQIGEGAFAKVYVAEHIKTKSRVSIKIIQSNINPAAKTHFENEINILAKISHPLVLELFEVITEGNIIAEVTEYVENGDLLAYINKRAPLPEIEAKRIFQQLVTVVEFLHKDAHVAHRDLKLENILLDRNNNIRLIDFGFAKEFNENTAIFSSLCGSPAYVAPEVATGRSYTTASDVWSLGVMLYGMLCGKLPFTGKTVQMQLQRIAFTEPYYSSKLGAAVKDLLQKILTKDQNKRITIKQIAQHEWSSNNPQLKIINKLYYETKSAGIDKDIINEMLGFGINTKQLKSELIGGDITDNTVIYDILARSKLNRLISIELSKNEPLHLERPNRDKRKSMVPSLAEAEKMQSKKSENLPNLGNETTATKITCLGEAGFPSPRKNGHTLRKVNIDSPIVHKY